MRIVIGNDHTAVEMKQCIKEYLEGQGHEVINVGTDSSESVDYPVFGEKVARAVVAKEADRGIAICGTGVGIGIACNKVRGVRCVTCSEPYSARYARLHNNANVLSFGARVVGQELAKMIVDEFIGTEFEGGRHERRVNMILGLEERF